MSDPESKRPRRGQRSFTHPLLRAAVDRNVYARQLRAFGRAVRGSLDITLPAAARRMHAFDVIEQTGSLGIDPESIKEFELEWLREVAHDLQDLVLLDALALAELAEHKVSVSPACWQTSSRALLANNSDSGIPLVDRAQSPQWHTPSFEPASRAWRAAFEACVRAIRADGASSLEARDCTAALRSIVMMASAFGVIRWDDPAAHRLNWLEGVASEVWKLLRDRLCDLDYSVDTCIASEQMRFKLTLHLRALAEQERATAPREHDERSTPAVPSCTCVVIVEDIPPSSDKSDRETLKSYEVLRQPVPIAPMPKPAALAQILNVLQDEFPWAEQASSYLDDVLTTASLLGVRKLDIPPVLLVGPPGSGKSRLARRFAELCSLPYIPIACGGSGDGKLLTGTSRGWATGEPCPIIGLMLRRRSASALVLLDEIEKATATHVNSPPLQSVLLGLLEPETAKRWRDGFLQAQCDLSNVCFWATANSLAGVSRALLSRFEIIYMPEPSPAHLQELARSITTDLEREWELPIGTLPRLPVQVSLGKVNAREIRAHIRRQLAFWTRDTLTPSRLH